jgi:predicted dehydrogenase
MNAMPDRPIRRRSTPGALARAALACALAAATAAPAAAQGTPRPLRLAIAGLVHGHVQGFAQRVRDRSDVRLVGVFDRDPALVTAFLEANGLPRTIGFGSLDQMLDAASPEAVAAFTSTADHPQVVAAAARRHVHVMMEKPLAVSLQDARRIAADARAGSITVIVNYETTWYPSLGAAYALVRSGDLGDVRKMVAMDGHEGPKEIRVGPEFLSWLTDPVQNGGGALFDFGCYGVNLMTWLMDNARPISVRALTQQIKPAIYPRVDDEATIVLEYPKAQGIVQASWNWPFGRKDLEVYGARGYAIATGGAGLRVRLPGHEEATRQPDPLPPAAADPVAYLLAVVRGTEQPSGPSSLENNVIVTEVLEAARESAKTGKTVLLAPAGVSR